MKSREDKGEELGTLAQDLFYKREELNGRLTEVLRDEASMWKTRAKQHWLREDDGNT